MKDYRPNLSHLSADKFPDLSTNCFIMMGEYGISTSFETALSMVNPLDRPIEPEAIKQAEQLHRKVRLIAIHQASMALFDKDPLTWLGYIQSKEDCEPT